MQQVSHPREPLRSARRGDGGQNVIDDKDPLYCEHSLYNSYSKLMTILSGDPFLLQYTFLIQFSFKTDENPLWWPPPPLVHIPYAILIQNWWTSSVAPPSSSSTHSFLIQFLFKADDNPLRRPLFLQCTFLIQFLFKIDEHPLWRPLPPPVHISYSVLNI
jgi:hypothetical protein